MVKKIQVAAESRRSEDFLIVARTDARTELGLEDAIARAEAYRTAGADILFIESPESESEMAAIGNHFSDIPLLANMVAGGRTPMLGGEQLAALGYQIAIHPIYGLGAATSALRQAYSSLLSSQEQAGNVDDIHRLNTLVGFEEIWALDNRFQEI